MMTHFIDGRSKLNEDPLNGRFSQNVSEYDFEKIGMEE